MRRTWLIRVAAICAAATAAALLVAGPASAGVRPQHDVVAAALAIPSRLGVHAHETTIRFQRAHGHTAKIDGVATAALSCDGCRARAFNVQMVYASASHTVVADNVATAWAARCAQCSGWAVSLQIVVAKSARSVTAANRSVGFTTACRHCAVKAAAIQIVIIAAPGRQLTRPQAHALRTLCDTLNSALTRIPVTSRTRAGRDRWTQTLTAATKHIQSVVAAGLHASAAKHAVGVRG